MVENLPMNVVKQRAEQLCSREEDNSIGTHLPWFEDRTRLFFCFMNGGSSVRGFEERMCETEEGEATECQDNWNVFLLVD